MKLIRAELVQESTFIFLYYFRTDSVKLKGKLKKKTFQIILVIDQNFVYFNGIFSYVCY